ncbi:hypothetical protein PN451_19260 [Dolichospermum planctonicum CS-1226]|uniref:Uncharacterized protein n=1 Tax=Dolichospermum planctonicum CS-1226 TaxID=3021751 RepID=A0ABT5AKY8_9CYAN|nr:hypothetical protein [Dolichospermum planctonicum]MDB9537944.1 hypothetical protein [Dolichospermum planctonicum CS-1226]
MFRSLIASIIAFAIAVTVVVNPAYAESTDTNYYVNNSGGNGDLVSIDESLNSVSDGASLDLANTFINGLWKGVVETAGVTIGGVIACYSIDGIATLVFPPAAALAAYCPAMPAIGGALGGGNTVNQLINAATKAM